MQSDQCLSQVGRRSWPRFQSPDWSKSGYISSDNCSLSHLFFSVIESLEECKTLAFPGRRLQKTTPMYPSFPANWSSVSSRLRSTRYSDVTERRLHELYPCSGPALLTNGIALMCHSFAPFPNLTHFLREDGLGTRQSLVGVCSLNQPVKHELP